MPAPPAGPPLDLPVRQSGDGVSPAPVFDAGVLASPDAGAGYRGPAVEPDADAGPWTTADGITPRRMSDGPPADAAELTEAASVDAPDAHGTELRGADDVGEDAAVTGIATDGGAIADAASEDRAVGGAPAEAEAEADGAEADGCRDDDSSQAEGENGLSEATQPNAVPALASAAGHDPYPTIQPVLTVPRQPGPASAADATPTPAGVPAAEADQQDLAVDADLGPDDPSSDESTADPADGDVPYPADGAEAGLPVSRLSAARTRSSR